MSYSPFRTVGGEVIQKAEPLVCSDNFVKYRFGYRIMLYKKICFFSCQVLSGTAAGLKLNVLQPTIFSRRLVRLLDKCLINQTEDFCLSGQG